MQYKDFMVNRFHEFGSSSCFEKIWSACFSHVKIRQFKSVCGKCKTCEKLSSARRSFHDVKTREQITTMHALHRSMFMGERMCYYNRRNEAMSKPSTVWSIISDGMAQIHCQLPHQGHLADFPVKLPQHIQGVLVHGKLMDIHRTFHNVVNNANAGIHSFLVTLEKNYKKEQRFPDKLYYQVDGGSENTAKVMFGIAELIVAKGLANDFYITRLPVGHTHEDIDAKFAKIWKRIRNDHVDTVKQYAERIKQALQPSDSDALPCEVDDMFVIPDYTTYMSHCIDANFGRYAKDKWTQLQWRFQSVPKSDDFPLGVKTTYRAYCRDEVFLINADDTKDCTFTCQNASVRWFPAASTTAPEGMYLLQSLPTGNIFPEAFIPDSRKIVDDVVKKVISTYTPGTTNHANPESKRNYCHEIVDEWKDFADNIAPATNSAAEHCVAHPLYIPLLKELFGTVDENTTREKRCHDDDIPVDVLFQDSVQWSRRGNKRPSKHPANFGPTLELISKKKQLTKDKSCTKEDARDGSDCCDSDGSDGSYSADNKCCYTALTQRQRIAHDNMITKYCGKTFKDIDDDDSSCHYLGVVVDVVFEKNSNTLCFSFRNTKMSIRASLEYIVVNYAISECEWLDLEEEHNNIIIVGEIDSVTKPKYVGWAVLGENETRKRGLFDVQDNMPQTTGDRSKRSLRSSGKG